MKILRTGRTQRVGQDELMVRRLRRFKRPGLTVSTSNTAHHGFDLDHSGKDSFRHREAGAKEVMLVADARWALMHEIGEAREPPLENSSAAWRRVDFVADRGLSHHTASGDRSLSTARGTRADMASALDIVAVASDAELRRDGSGVRSQPTPGDRDVRAGRTRRPSYDDAARRSSVGRREPRRRVWSMPFGG